MRPPTFRVESTAPLTVESQQQAREVFVKEFIAVLGSEEGMGVQTHSYDLVSARWRQRGTLGQCGMWSEGQLLKSYLGNYLDKHPEEKVNYDRALGHGLAHLQRHYDRYVDAMVDVLGFEKFLPVSCRERREQVRLLLEDSELSETDRLEILMLLASKFGPNKLGKEKTTDALRERLAEARMAAMARLESMGFENVFSTKQIAYFEKRSEAIRVGNLQSSAPYPKDLQPGEQTLHFLLVLEMMKAGVGEWTERCFGQGSSPTLPKVR